MSIVRKSIVLTEQEEKWIKLQIDEGFQSGINSKSVKDIMKSVEDRLSRNGKFSLQ